MIYKASEFQKKIEVQINKWILIKHLILKIYIYDFMKKREKKSNFKLTSEKIHSLNIYIFLGFNLTLVSLLGFIWMKSSINSIV